MFLSFCDGNGSALGWAVLITVVLGVAGCAKNYVVLLPNDDGTTGKVAVVLDSRER